MTVHKTSVLILGSSGLLGSSVSEILERQGFAVTRHGRRPEFAPAAADLTDARQARALLDAVRPEVIVNTAALANVDDCERDPRQAYLSNVHIVENLADWVQDAGRGTHLVQISTDQVYDGPGPHAETPVTLTNYYGFSKYTAELAASRVPSTVLRTNFFGPSRTPRRLSLSDWLAKACRSGEGVTVFDDVLFSPLSLETLGAMIGRVIARRERGLFNLGSRDGMSKADFALALADILGVPADLIRRGSVAALDAPAYRPRDMRMDSSRFEAAFGVRLPTLTEELQSIRKDYVS